MAYYVYGWEDVARVFAAAATGDLGPARDSYGDPTGPGADNGLACSVSSPSSSASHTRLRPDGLDSVVRENVGESFRLPISPDSARGWRRA